MQLPLLSSLTSDTYLCWPIAGQHVLVCKANIQVAISRDRSEGLYWVGIKCGATQCAQAVAGHAAAQPDRREAVPRHRGPSSTWIT